MYYVVVCGDCAHLSGTEPGGETPFLRRLGSFQYWSCSSQEVRRGRRGEGIYYEWEYTQVLYCIYIPVVVLATVAVVVTYGYAINSSSIAVLL